jgi:hypothetical protein
MRPSDDGSVLHLTLEEWDQLIGRHLHMIEAASEIIERHANQILGMPDFETRAAQDLDKTETLLGRALTRVATARQALARKQRVC